MKSTTLNIILALLASVTAPMAAESFGPAFTYQGRLTDAGQPAQGSYDMRFTLYDHPTAGTVIGRVITNTATSVSSGLFNLTLDFTDGLIFRSDVYNGEVRWLELAVRTNGSKAGFITLSPRQQVTPTPYALFASKADTVPATGLQGVLPDARLSTNVARLDSAATFDGSVTANDELRALRLEIGMFCDARLPFSSVAGGLWNTNLGTYSFLGGGITNTIQTNTSRAFLGAGSGNVIQHNADAAFLGGGFGNTIRSNADYATLAGGYLNTVGGTYATVPGGTANAALADYTFAAGRRAKAEHQGAFVWADSTSADFHSSLNDQVSLRANGGVYVEGSGGFSAPQLHLFQTDSNGWARLRLSVAGANGSWNIYSDPNNDPYLRFWFSGPGSSPIRFSSAGRVTADSFTGDGSSLGNLNASALASGTVPEARLSSNVALLQAGKLPDTNLSSDVAMLHKSQTFTSANVFKILQVVDYSGPDTTGGSIRVGDNVPSADPKLIRFGDSSAVTIGENGANDRLELRAESFAVIPSTGSGFVGIGKTNPATALDVNGTVTASQFHGANGGQLKLHTLSGSLSLALLGDSSGAGLVNVYNASNQVRVRLDGRSTLTGGGMSLFGGNGMETIELLGTADAAQTGGQMLFRQGDGTTTIQFDGEVGTKGGGWAGLYKGNGTLGIALQAQDSSLSGGKISLYGDGGTETIQMLGTADAAHTGGQMLFKQADGTTTIQFDGEVGTKGGGWAGLYKGNGTLGIILQAQDSNGESRVTTQVVEITGGSDLSERFDVSDVGQELRPGMLVSIDPQHAGRLTVSTRAYDRTVAGVISGAGGVKPGLLMSQHGSVASGQHPIALSGRTYCLMDADEGPIEPGDLITTSNTPGHGMKVREHARAQGAIIGKAMTSLKEGKGLVLVLVSLQ